MGKPYRGKGGQSMIIYLSGAMSSCMDTYKQIFADKQAELESLGYIVVNPASLPIGLNNDRYMPICLSMLDSADAIYLFNDWENSKGALLETAYAEYQNKVIIL